MDSRISILDYYSKATPLTGEYTEYAKKQIAYAFFFKSPDSVKQKKIAEMNWTPKLIQTLCQSKLATEHILTMIPEIERKRADSLERQVAQQKEGLADNSLMIEKVPHINLHTLIDYLYKHSSDIENKLQISFMPYPEDDELLLQPEEEFIPKYYAIRPVYSKPKESEEKESQEKQVHSNPRPKIIQYSVYDIKKIPMTLIDFALHGTYKSHYTGEEEGMLLMEWADKIEAIKDCLIQWRPLGYDPEKPEDIQDYTERILALTHGDKKLYMLSENTPKSYHEKNRRKYTDTHIRYNFFDNKQNLVKHLLAQLPNAQSKMVKWEVLWRALPNQQQLKEIYTDPERVTAFKELIVECQKELLGQTKTEQLMQDYINSLHFKNASADWLVCDAMKKTMEVGHKKQEEKVDYMKRHIESLMADSDF